MGEEWGEGERYQVINLLICMRRSDREVWGEKERYQVINLSRLSKPNETLLNIFEFTVNRPFQVLQHQSNDCSKPSKPTCLSLFASAVR